MTLITENATCFVSEEFSAFIHVTSSPRYPKGNAHAEKAMCMVKQIYTQCDDPLFGMLVLKTMLIQDIKELPDKIFGCPLNTQLAQTRHSTPVIW